MANEFKIKKGLIVTGASGGTVVDIQGSQGQLFSVTDDLSGSIFAVSDISGVPILDVNSSGTVTIDGLLTGDDATFSKRLTLNSPDYAQHLTMRRGIYGYDTIITGDRVDFSPTADTLNFKFLANLQTTGDVSVSGGDLNVGNSGTVNSVINMLGTNDSFIEKDTGNHLYFANNVSDKDIRFRVKDDGTNVIALTIDGPTGGNSTFSSQVFSAATSSGDASSTLTTKGYVDGLITGATIYRGAWQAGISATSSAATTASTTLTVTAAILDADGNTPVLVGAVVTGEGITGIVKVASVTSSTVYVLDTAITATATAYIFSPIYGAPDLSGVTETSGYYYICSEAGSATPNGADSEPNTWNVGDWCIYNDVSGTGQWQKIDNSSVLSGAGTGQTVALWEGPSSVTDSETLGNAPITVSGNNTTFAGQITGQDSGSVQLNLKRGSSGTDGNTSILFTQPLGNGYIGVDANGSFSYGIAANLASSKLKVDRSGNATFAGNVTASNFYGLAQDLAVTSNDTFNGTYSLLWHAGADVYSSTWMTVNGSNDTLTVPTIAADLNGTINTATTGVTQTAGNNSTLIATTAYADAAAGAVPIGNYLPLAGGTMTGTNGVVLPDNFNLKIGTGSDLQIYHSGTESKINNDVGNLSITNFANDSDIILSSDNGSGATTPYLVLDGSTTHAYFSNPGNVGIGTITPGAKLEVVGTTIIDGGTGVSSSGVFHVRQNGDGSSNGITITSSNATSHRIWKGANGTLNIGPSTAVSSFVQTLAGNVGIGTTSPGAKLVISGGGGAISDNGFQINSGYGYSGTGVLEINPSAASHIPLSILSKNGQTANLVNVTSFSGTAGNLFNVQSSGNVGIGETSPLVKLQIRGSEMPGTTDPASVEDMLTLYRFGSPTVWAGGASLALGRYSTGGSSYPKSRLDFKLKDAQGSNTALPETTVMTMQSNGNIGIGTTGPRDTLEIVGNMRFVDGEDHLMIKPNNAIHGADFIVGDGVATTDTPVMSLNGLYGGQVTIQTQGNTIANKTVLDVQGTQGQLFSVTDDLSGDIFSVADISGVPIMNVNSDGTSYFDGNVGIGTTTPTSELQISSGSTETTLTIGASGDVSDTASKIFLNEGQSGVTDSKNFGFSLAYDGNGSYGLPLNTFGIIRHNNSSTGAIVLSAQRTTGNVGIGTDSPSASLDVVGSGLSTMLRLSNTEANATIKYGAILGRHYTNAEENVTGMLITSSSNALTGQTVSIGGGISSANAVNEIIFYTAANNTTLTGSEKMRIDSSGNVGIGTTSPNYKLDVESSTTPLHLNRTGGATALIGLDIAGVNRGLIGATTTAAFVSYSSAAASLMTILNTGNVGIGTTTPGDKLHVNGTVRSQAPATSDWGLIGFNSAGTASSGLWFDNGSGDILLRRSDNSLQTRIRSAGNSYINGGNLGLNTTGPAERLTINSGRMLVTNSTTPIYIKVNSGYKSWVHHISSDDGYIFAPSTVDGGETWDWANQTKLGANGVVRAKNFELSSDERFKDNVKDIKDNEIKVAFKSFEIKSSPGEKRYGVIAQELEKNNPELVTTDTEGFKSVKYIDLLIAKIAELEARLEKLEK